MSLSLRVDSLVEQGLLREALKELDTEASLPSPLTCLKIHLQSHVGNLRQAQAAAESMLRRETDPRGIAICQEVVGRSMLVHGDSAELGLQLLADARELAAAKLGIVRHARYACDYADALLHRIGIIEAAEELPRLRKIVMRAGDPHSLAVFHLLSAELKIKQGHLGRSLTDLRIISDLLVRKHSVVTEGKWAITSSAQAVLDDRVAEAMALAETAVQCARASGSVSVEIPALGMLAHVLLVMGEFKVCDRRLELALKIARPGGQTIIGLLDTKLQLRMAIQNEAESARLADEVYSLSQRFNSGHSYYGLWHILTRLKWLLATNRATEALALAETTLPHVDRMADRNLLQRMQMITAEILGACGRPLDGAALLATVRRANPDASLEMVAEASRVSGALAVDDAVAARTHFERAIRVFHAIGQRTACAAARRQAGFGHADTGRPAALTPARVIERAAAMSTLAAHPPLVGIEVLDLMADARVCTHAALIEHDGTGLRRTLAARPANLAVPDALSPYSTDIPLGTLGSRTYELRVEPTQGSAARTTLAAVERLAHASVTLAQLRTEAREHVTAWTEQSPEEQLGLVYASEAMQALVKMTRRIAPTNVTVLITGETGAGKEVFARALHQASHRRDQVFLPYNCTTVPRDMLDSQLFGFRRGAFTGATEEYPGLIRGAAGGTLFLDEIGEMPLDVQPKLLRFLESGEVLPLGESRPVHVDVRIIAATNADLDQLVNEGRFREDLYYRLNVVRLRVPPLRDRREEVPLLVQSLLERIARESQVEPVRVSDEAMEHLALYHWPGNARQLANELRRLSALADPGSVIMPEHLSPDIAVLRPPAEAPANAAELLVRTDQPLSSATEHVERVLIAQALDACHGNLERAAQQLGLSRKGLFLKRQRLGIL